MMLSKAAEEEMRELSYSSSFKKDMETIACSRHNPFVKAGSVDVDVYIAFVSEFNEFINHEPKPFSPMKEVVFRL